MSACMAYYHNFMIPFFILLSQCCYHCSAFGEDYFIDKPDREVYRDEGSDVALEWLFHVGHWFSGSPTKISEFLFGVWEPRGFMQNKILAVNKHNVVLKQRGFERKVDWRGKISDCVNCKATVKMYNLTLADFKTYGVEVEPSSLDRSPLTNWVTLVKFVPAEIIKCSPRIEVEEGNATTIECKATGRPPPSVMIKRKNQTLPCNSTGPGYCVSYILAANKSVHEGEYLCLVQQKSSRQILKRFLNLTVLEKRKPPTIAIEDNRNKNNTKQDDRTPMFVKTEAVIVIMVVVLITEIAVCISVCLLKRKLWQERPRIASLEDRRTMDFNEKRMISLSEDKGDAYLGPNEDELISRLEDDEDDEDAELRMAWWKP